MNDLHIQPEYDARAECWLTARNLLEAARKLTTDRKGKVHEPLPDLYRGLLEEARLWIALANADESVGLEAGAYLLRQREAEMLRKDDWKTKFGEFSKKPE